MNRSVDLHLVTFAPTSAEDVIAKLRREIERIEPPVELELVVDHVNDAFRTAWHVHDWIWNAIKDEPALKEAVLKFRGMDGEPIKDQNGFGLALARRFVPLKICRLIAVAPRRVLVALGTNRSDGLDTFDIVSAESSIEREIVPEDLTPLVMIMGKPIAATRLLWEIEDYWVTWINECCIHFV